MAQTLLQVAQRIARKMGLDDTFTAFSDSDETNDIKYWINDAYLELMTELTECTSYLIDISGSLTTSASTRLYALDSDARIWNLFDWSFSNETENDAKIRFATLRYVQERDAKYDETEGTPYLVYPEGDQLGVYPVPDGTYTIKYKFKKPFTELTATTDTFVTPDEWVRRFIDVRVQAMRARVKGWDEVGMLEEEADRELALVIVDAQKFAPLFFRGDRKF